MASVRIEVTLYFTHCIQLFSGDLGWCA